VPIGPGTKLGQYVVQDAIGEGAMGVVYRAYHPQLERTGAVKVLHGIGLDLDSAARFRREAQAIAQLRHPNVLNVFDFGEFEGTPYMIVEYVEGGSLAPRVKSGALDQASALAYLRGIAAALDYAHKHGIVHRDVKPANVLMGPDDNPILADFGLAKLMESSSIKSLTGVTTGTPAYMAPEQVSGSQVGPAADRYSLAVMAYEMLTGSLPFDEGGVLEVLYAQVHREPSAPSSVNHALGPRIDSVILRGMAKDPTARWNRCLDFVTALETAMKPETASAAEKTIAFAAPTAVDKTVAIAPPVAPRKRTPRAVTAEVQGTTVFAGEAAIGALRGPDPEVPHPVITWRGVKVPVRERMGSRKRNYAFAGAAAAILLLLLGVCGYVVLLPPSLHLSRSIVAPGDSIVVSANHIPSGQSGQIELHSVIQSYAFRADAIGRVTRDVAIPYDVELGAHRIYICWSGACRASAALQVVDSVAVAPSDSPAPGSSPTAGTSPSGTPHSTPGSTPHSTPGSTPQSSPAPAHSPSPSPKPTPSPSPKPTPSPTCYSTSATLTSPGSVVAGQNITLMGTHFKPGKITVTYYAGGTAISEPSLTASASCTFTANVRTSPLGLLQTTRADKVVACDSAGRCATANFKSNLL